MGTGEPRDERQRRQASIVEFCLSVCPRTVTIARPSYCMSHDVRLLSVAMASIRSSSLAPLLSRFGVCVVVGSTHPPNTRGDHRVAERLNLT